MAYPGQDCKTYWWGGHKDSPESFGFKISGFPETEYGVEKVTSGYLKARESTIKNSRFSGPLVASFNFSEEDRYSLNIRVHQKYQPGVGEVTFTFNGPALKKRENVVLSKRLSGDRTKRSLLNYASRIILTTAAAQGHYFLRGASVYSEEDDRLVLLFGPRHSGKTATALESVRQTNYKYDLVSNSWIHVWLPPERDTNGGLELLLADDGKTKVASTLEHTDFGVVFPQMYPEKECPVRMDISNYQKFWADDMDTLDTPPYAISKNNEVVLGFPAYPHPIKITPDTEIIALWPNSIAASAYDVAFREQSNKEEAIKENWRMTWDRVSQLYTDCNIGDRLQIATKREAFESRVGVGPTINRLAKHIKDFFRVSGNPTRVIAAVENYLSSGERFYQVFDELRPQPPEPTPSFGDEGVKVILSEDTVAQIAKQVEARLRNNNGAGNGQPVDLED